MNATPKFYTTNGAISSAGENAVAKWLEGNVLHCQTALVTELVYDMWDEVENLYDESNEAIENFLAETPLLTDKERNQLKKLSPEEKADKARDLGWEPDINEIYEWYLVSPYFGQRLREKNHPVFEAYGCVWWGRCACGQWIGMDPDIVEMAIIDGVVT